VEWYKRKKQYEYIYRALRDELLSPCTREAICMAQLMESQSVAVNPLPTTAYEVIEMDSLRSSTKRCSLDTFSPRKKLRRSHSSFQNSQNGEDTRNVVDSWA